MFLPFSFGDCVTVNVNHLYHDRSVMRIEHLDLISNFVVL